MGEGIDVYEFAYREVDRFIRLEKVYPCEEDTITYNSGGFRRYDWTSPCRFCYRNQFLFDNELLFPLAKSGEDGPFVEMALYHARTFQRVNRIIFSYWENPASCVHTTSKIASIFESYKALKQEELYFSKRNVFFDADEGFVWMCVANLPKICATGRYSAVKKFMNSGCLRILEDRPDIRFGDITWAKIEKWRSNSLRYWLEQRIKYGIPLWCKNAANKIPGICHIVGYLFNRYHRGFTTIH